eukprot:353286-Chlamydomonas_euryale.AAC.4
MAGRGKHPCVWMVEVVGVQWWGMRVRWWGMRVRVCWEGLNLRQKNASCCFWISACTVQSSTHVEGDMIRSARVAASGSAHVVFTAADPLKGGGGKRHMLYGHHKWVTSLADGKSMANTWRMAEVWPTLGGWQKYGQRLANGRSMANAWRIAEVWPTQVGDELGGWQNWDAEVGGVVRKHAFLRSRNHLASQTHGHFRLPLISVLVTQPIISFSPRARCALGCKRLQLGHSSALWRALKRVVAGTAPRLGKLTLTLTLSPRHRPRHSLSDVSDSSQPDERNLGIPNYLNFPTFRRSTIWKTNGSGTSLVWIQQAYMKDAWVQHKSSSKPRGWHRECCDAVRQTARRGFNCGPLMPPSCGLFMPPSFGGAVDSITSRSPTPAAGAPRIHPTHPHTCSRRPGVATSTSGHTARSAAMSSRALPPPVTSCTCSPPMACVNICWAGEVWGSERCRRLLPAARAARQRPV